jgi:hypothetical protein
MAVIVEELLKKELRHLLLTPQAIALRRAFPWAHSLQKILHNTQPTAFSSEHLLVGSDYGGDHKSSNYRTYAYLVIGDTPSCWLRRQTLIRSKYLGESRRMSFKRLDDVARQTALFEFLNAANVLDGNLVVIAVHKNVRLHPMSSVEAENLAKNFGSEGKWKGASFELAFRKAHFFALLVSQWARPMSDVTWITDQDEFVANEDRHDVMQKIAARITVLYLNRSMRVFAMNTTKDDGPELEFEDFVSIPDLAAGMVGELSSRLSKYDTWSNIDGRHELFDDHVQDKTSFLVDWFWKSGGRLRKTCVIVDKQPSQSRIFKLDLM